MIKMNKFLFKVTSYSHIISTLRHGLEAKTNMFFFKLFTSFILGISRIGCLPKLENDIIQDESSM